ncbi:hypothetical protein BJX64DRAFT_288626 [Aspergillus heterothallicus]
MALQDILGQLPLLKSYTHVLLCFSLPDSDREAVLAELQCATKRLLAAFPFLAGNVVHRGLAPGNSGTFTVEYDADNVPDKSVLFVKDVSNLLPAYTTLSAAQAPPSMLPGSIVASPRPAFPRVYNEESAPVLEIQASLVTDGLLLDIAAQHNIIDATGIFYIANLLSKLMDDHPNPIPQADLLLGNCDRQNLIPLLPPEDPLPEDLAIYTGARPPPVDPEILTEFKWCLLHFSPEAVACLHAKANSQPEDFIPGITSVSINDAITAFAWQHLTIARCTLYPTLREDDENNETQLTRAADLRRTMKLSPAYMGHMVRTANTRLPLRTVTTSTLASLSSHLRSTILSATTPHAVRSYATLLSRTPDKSRILYAGTFNPLCDFSCSSVAHVTMPRFGNVLGTPEFVRRPTFRPLPGGMYVGPGRGGRGLDAVVCFRRGEMEMLQKDEVWKGVVEVVE